MRIRYWRTSSRDVTRPCSIAARISGIVASTTVNELRGAGAAGFFVCADTAVKAAPTSAAAAHGGEAGTIFMGVIISLRVRPKPDAAHEVITTPRANGLRGVPLHAE